MDRTVSALGPALLFDVALWFDYLIKTVVLLTSRYDLT